MKSVYKHPQMIQEYRELSLQRVLKLQSDEVETIQGLQLNPFGVITKRGHPRKWCLIVDLSSAKGMSINDGINAEYCSITYASVDDAVKMILELGQGTLLAKLDLKEAYQVVPAHPLDRPGLGMHWQRKIYIDGALLLASFLLPKSFPCLGKTFSLSG